MSTIDESTVNLNTAHENTHVYFAMQIPPTLAESSPFSDLETAFSKKIVCCTDWKQLISLLKLNPTSICVSAAHFKGHLLVEAISMIETFAKLVDNSDDISITIGVDQDTPYSLVKEAQKTRIMGLVPCSISFGVDDTARGLSAQWSNIPYWPKHIIEQLPGAKKTVKSTCTAIKLTNRQQQIFDLVVARGCSNKHIAKLLELSESTVKLHMSAVFKKYGVKNRTQLAVFSKSTN